MKNFKSTKRALLTSVLSMVLCFTMLLGTTFAWFTDSVTSKNNIITAGNLDIELYFQVEGQTDWTKVTDKTNIFKENALWEPGYTEVVKLKVVNEGSLALKSQLGINIAEETTATNVEGNEFKLSDYIKYGIVDGEHDYTRASAIAAVDASATALNISYSKSINLEPTEECIVTMVVYMPTTVGNEANYRGTVPPSITLGINLFATQMTFEPDSFGNDYDKGAPWTGGVDTDWYFENPTATEFVLSSAEELAGFAALVNGTATAPVTTFAATEPETVHDNFKGKTVKLDRDIDLRGIAWTPIGRIGTTSTDFTYAFKGTFDGQNHTIYNLEVNAYGWAGVFGIAYEANINNLKVSGVSIRANRMTGAVVGQLYGSIDNCHVANADIMVTPNSVGNSYDNGDKVGGIVGWIGDNGNKRTLTNCSATSVKLGAYRDVGGIAGYVAYSTTVSGNSVDGLTITVDQESFNYGYKDANAGAIYGRTSGDIIDENNTQSEDIVISSTLIKDGLTLKQDGVTGTTTLYLVPSDYQESTVKVPEGVTNIGGYAFAYNSNVERIVLSSTVTTLNDRAFRDTSASEVVLNEGLTNISYQAFRNALNVKSVVIPSTVTTISKEAFQNSGITSLTIPANVTTLEYGACRDMKNLSTVIIEGNVIIPVYAFRACTNLTTVVLTGEDVTFDGKGMIFTNKENGDGSAMTIYVANETVKERLMAADTASKDYGGYNIVIDEDFSVNVSNATELQNALNAATKDVLINFTADITGNILITQKANVNITINGANKKFTGVMTVFGDGRQTQPETLTIKNVNFVAGNGADSCIVSPDRSVYNKYSYAHNLTVENCTFTDPDGAVNCAAVRTEDGGDMNFVIKNCTVDSTMHSLVQFQNIETSLTIEGCKVYSKNGANLNSTTNLVMNNCEFDVMGYAIRFGVNSGGNLGTAKSYTITNSTLKSACDDGDAIIIFRASAVDAVLTLNNTTLVGTTEISGNTDSTTINR